MKKCDCYRERKEAKCSEDGHYYEAPYAECWGTKERERCLCKGDARNCDFYPEKRKEAKTVKSSTHIDDYVNGTQVLYLHPEDFKDEERYETILDFLNVDYIDHAPAISVPIDFRRKVTIGTRLCKENWVKENRLKVIYHTKRNFYDVINMATGNIIFTRNSPSSIFEYISEEDKPIVYKEVDD